MPFLNTGAGAQRIGRNLQVEGSVAQRSENKSFMYVEALEEEITLSGSSPSVGTGGLFAADSDILGATYEITEAIAGATNFLIGDDAGSPDTDRLWAAQSTYTLGTKKTIPQGAVVGAKFQGGTAGNVRLTWTGTATAGKVRVTVFVRRIVVPA